MDKEEVIPTCDICGEPEDQDPTNGNEYNWNGETGNHQSCERDFRYYSELYRGEKRAGMTGDYPISPEDYK